VKGASDVRDRRDPFERDYAGDSSTLRDARKDIVVWLTERGFDQDLQDRAALVLSELATNAVQASPGRAYAVCLRDLGDRSAVLVVTSHTDYETPPPRAHWTPTSTRAVRGRGLMIVDAVADGVEVDLPSHDTVVVTATLRSASPAGPV
jgi:anti-sigma regulatory factor (Ser/Thr protein kinase)